MRGPKSVDVVAAVYPDREHAQVILDMLKKMHSATTITLVDAALATKDESGQIHIDETHEVTTKKGAIRGAAVTGILGVIYPPSLIASLVVGGGIGGLMGKLRDTGIKLPQIESIAKDLEPGKAAVIALVDSENMEQTRKAMDNYGGTVVTQQLDSAHAEELLGAVTEEDN